MIWACHPTSIECEIASLIFGYVGIIALYIIELLFARRIVRSQHPHVGWTLKFSIPFTILFIIVVATIICLIVAIVIMFDTRSDAPLHSALVIQRYGATLYAVMSFLPMLTVGISSLARRIPKIRRTSTIDKFGEGSMRTKVAIVIITSLFLSAGAIYRAGVILAPPSPVTAAVPAYLSKACFYVFTFTIEFAIVLFWLLVRIDRRFYVPDGAWGPHSYAGGFVFAGESGNEKGRKSLGARPIEQSIVNLTSASTGSHGSWAPTDKSPQFSDSMSRISHHSQASTVANDLAPPTRVARASSRMSQISSVSRFSSSRLSVSRTSLRASIAESRRRNSAIREQNIAWGGVTRDEVKDTVTETRGEILPYAGFRIPPNSVYDPDADIVTAADVGIEGPVREMGLGPEDGQMGTATSRETGRW